MTETWKPIKNYEGFYECSDLGNIRRLVTKGNKLLLLPRPLKPWLTLGGYPTVYLTRPAVRKSFLVHRVIAKHFLGDGGELEVNHKNGIKSDNRVFNLEYVTRKENAVHASLLGKFNRGNQCHNARLTPKIVRIIRKSKKLQYELAAIYGVTPSAIQGVLSGRTWRHV